MLEQGLANTGFSWENKTYNGECTAVDAKQHNTAVCGAL